MRRLGSLRFAVISDIHGNCFALDATLQDLRRRDVDQVICLGDTVQGGAQPDATIERLRKLSCPVVLGNADAWVLTNANDAEEQVTQQQVDVRSWTLSKLSPDDLDFLRGYQPTIIVDLDSGRQLLGFHGSPKSYNDILYPDSPQDVWERLLDPYSPAIMTGGHTHTQQVRRVAEGLFFNPGSVGVVYDYHLPKDQYHTEPWAEYAILSYGRDQFSLEFRRVPYDVNELAKIIGASGRPHAESLIAEYQPRTQH